MRVTWFSSLALGLALLVPGVSEAQGLLQPRCNTCQPRCQTCKPATTPDGSEPAPSEMNPDLANALAGNEQASMDFGSTSGPQATTPGMLGDSYIAGATVDYTLPGVGTYRTIVPYGGRYKCADNTGVVPTDRVSFSYKHFHNALQSSSLSDGGAGLNQSNGNVDNYTLGIEKTFAEQLASLEIRVPFYSGSVFSTMPGTTPANANDSSISSPTFGNLSFILKALLAQYDTVAFGAGLGLDVPTADKTIGQALSLQSITYSNKEWFIAPFVSFLAVPNDDWWMQGVVQFSIVTGHNILNSPPGAGGGGGGPITLLYQEQDMVFTTLNVGKWLVRNPAGAIAGVAVIGELNWTATLNNTQVVSATSNTLTITTANSANEQNIFNLTTGVHFQLTELSNFRVSGVVPLRDGNSSDNTARNRYFDSEISVQFNKYF